MRGKFAGNDSEGREMEREGCDSQEDDLRQGDLPLDLALAFRGGESCGRRRRLIWWKEMDHLNATYLGLIDPLVGAHQDC